MTLSDIARAVAKWPTRFAVWTIVAVLAFAAVFAMTHLVARLRLSATFQPPGAQPAQPAKEIRTVERVALQPQVIKVYPPKAKTDFGLPQAAIGNINEHVATATKVPSAERPHTVVATLDAQTGEAQSYIREDPLPWLTRDPRGELGISYGLRDGLPMGRVSLRQNLIQIKAVHVGGLATLDQDGRWYMGAGAWWRW